MLGEQAQDFAPLLRRDRPVVDHRADQAVGILAAAAQEKDDRQGDFAFAQVAADRLAERGGVGGVVEQVVDQLERDAEVEAVVAQRVGLLRRDVAEHPADLRAPAEQEGGLAPDDLEMLVLGDVDVAGLGELIKLALDHPQRDVAEHPDDLERVLRERHRHALDVEIVPEQDGDVVAPARMDGQTAAPEVGAVDDVVVDQRGGMDELDHRRVEHGAVAGVSAEPRRHQQDRGADPFASAALDVAAHLGDERHAGLDVADELLLDRLEVAADRFEDLRQIVGDGHFLRCVTQWGYAVDWF